MNRYAALTLLWSLISAFVSAQEFLGLRTDNYSGSNGMLFNPATPIAGKLPWDVNIVSVGVNEDNNYISISNPMLKYISSADSVLNVDYFHPKQIYAHGNVLLQLPSGFVKFDDYAAGIFFTVRTAGYFLSDKQETAITGLKDIPLDTETIMPAFNTGTLIWGEIGLNGEITLERNSVYALHMGVNLKYLSGFEALAFRNNNDFTFTKDSVNTALVDFNTNFDYTQNLGSNLLYDPANYAINGNGFAMDFGMYFVQNERTKFKYSKYQNYTWKYGFSLLDFGMIKFKNNSGTYHLENMDQFIVANSVLDSIGDIDEFNRTGSRILYDNSSDSQDGSRFTMYLPAAIMLSADHAFQHHFYAQAIVVRRIPHMSTNLIARANTFSLIPRYETRAFGIALPMNLYEDKEFRFGLSARLWFLTLGTDNMLTFFNQKDYSSIDMYIGIKLNPFWLVDEKKKKILECLKW